jgi:hypothetical protein
VPAVKESPFLGLRYYLERLGKLIKINPFIKSKYFLRYGQSYLIVRFHPIIVAGHLKGNARSFV